MFSQVDTKLTAFIFHKGSPLKRVFDRGLDVLRENGVPRYLEQRWFGREVGKGGGSGSSETMVLSSGQVVLVFAVVGAAIAASAVVFVGEKVYDAAVKRKRKPSETGDGNRPSDSSLDLN